jgi:magnesium transporter
MLEPMTKVATWIDLLDPTMEQVREVFGDELHEQALDVLVEAHLHGDEPRPKLESHGDYVLGLFLIPVVVAKEDRVYYQEVDMVLSHKHVLTVRKTPSDGKAFDLAELKQACQEGMPTGMIAYRIVDDVAEGFLDMIDDLEDEIDELEDRIDDLTNADIRRRISDLRHDTLRIRRTLGPTRDAVRRVIDNRVEIEGPDELFPREIEVHFGDAYDKLLRATEGLESARDLISGVRDYHQSKVANDQNEVMKALTVISALLLAPTFLVGLYGQNFRHMPELDWKFGYLFSWALIATSVLLLLVYFRRKRWI